MNDRHGGHDSYIAAAVVVTFTILDFGSDRIGSDLNVRCLLTVTRFARPLHDRSFIDDDVVVCHCVSQSTFLFDGNLFRDRVLFSEAIGNWILLLYIGNTSTFSRRPR